MAVFRISSGSILCLLLIAGCESRTRSPLPPGPSAAPIKAAANVADAQPLLTDSAAATAAADDPADAGTTGRVACGTSSCNLRTHACCRKVVADLGHCVAINTPCVAEEEQRLACDDLSDCKAGLTCCQDWPCSGPGCPMEHKCLEAPCPTGSEVCARGGTCREGLTCILSNNADARSNGMGTCEPPPPTIPCGAALTCTNGKGCCWNSKTKTGSCGGKCFGENEDLANSPKEILHCTSAKSCGDLTCGKILGLGGFSCMGPSIAGDRAIEILCATLKDCPPRNMAGPPLACIPSRDLPPGVKICKYGELPPR